MNDKLASISNREMIEELRNRLGTDDTTGITIFLNTEGYQIIEIHRSAESLKMEGISMKNVFGCYVKDEE